MKRTTYRPRANAAALLALLLAITTVVASVGSVYAATLTSASLQLSDSRPSATGVSYTLSADNFTGTSNIGCIIADLGTAVSGSGAISGMDTSTAAAGTQTVTSTGTWTADNTGSANNILKATIDTPVAPQSGSQSFTFTGIKNGSTVDTPFYGVVTTYSDAGCTTTVDTVTVQFIYTAGQQVSADVAYSLSFAVAGLASATSVNGASSTVDVSSGNLPFGTMSTGSNTIAAQSLTVSTNAGNGYTVYINSTGPLSNGSTTLPDWATGTNTAPTTFPAAGTEAAFGYTTADTSLGTGTANRFSTNKCLDSHAVTRRSRTMVHQQQIRRQTLPYRIASPETPLLVPTRLQ